MLKVKTLVAHDNSYGDKFHKQVGSVYELPEQDAQNLIDQKIVEKHGTQAK